MRSCCRAIRSFLGARAIAAGAALTSLFLSPSAAHAKMASPLQAHGPAGLLVWQWLALAGLCLAAWLLGMLGARVSRAALGKVVGRTNAAWDDALLDQSRGPLILAWSLVVARAALPLLELPDGPHGTLTKLISAALLLSLFWMLFRSLGVAAVYIASSTWARESPASRSLLPLATRVSKLLVLAISAVAVLAQLGYPVASLIAGLGIGGLAVALAAQKTIENLFGAFSLAMDQPFREGDFVRIDDFVGTVEAIGLRSTRIRTLDRTLITIPNGKLAEMRLESFTARDRIRLYAKMRLVYETTRKQLEEVLEGFERAIRAEPKFWPDSITVRFEAFGESALEIEVMAWFTTQDFDEFKLIRQRVLMEFMAVVEQAGTSFALPTRTVHMASARDEGPALPQRGTASTRTLPRPTPPPPTRPRGP